MDLVDFDFDASLTHEYLQLVRRVHEHDSRWIAPLKRATQAQLAPDFPFYSKPGNLHRGFALRRHGKLVGHVLATLNAELKDEAHGSIGALGFLETVPDYEYFHALIEPALDWLHTQAGATRVWATMNFDIWHSYRVMILGFEEPAFFGEPRNTRWQPEFLDRYGFAQRKLWNSSSASRQQLQKLLTYFEPRYSDAVAMGYRFDALQPKDSAEIAALHGVVAVVFKEFLGYTPIPLAEFDDILVRYLRFTGTELATVLRVPTGELAGFSIAFPDPSEALRRLDGRDDWLHRLSLLLWQPPSSRALHYMIGVLPEARAVQNGLGSALAYRTLRLILDGGFERTTFALVAEDSPARYFSTAQVEQAEREYALYQLDL